jgi:hypothetical protein
LLGGATTTSFCFQSLKKLTLRVAEEQGMKLKRVSAGIIASLVLLCCLMVLVNPSPAKAVTCSRSGENGGTVCTAHPFESLSLSSQMLAWTQLSSITSAMGNSGRCTVAGATTSRNGQYNLFVAGDNKVLNTGYHYDGSDGKRECGNFTAQELVQLAGYPSAAEMVEAANTTNNQAFYNFARSKTNLSRTPLIEYAILMYAFTNPNGCAATVTNNSGGPYFTVTGDNKLQQVDYKFDSDKSVPVGPGMDAGSDNVFECNTIANKLKNRDLALNVINYNKLVEDATGSNPASQINSAAGGAAAPITCESKNPKMGWFTCPLVEQLDKMIGAIDGAIQNQLVVDRLYDEQGSLYRVWQTMRNIALLILLPIMLVMVSGTALGYAAFDAYTVKKALPRMVAATLFILLSWPICTFLIDLSDVVGIGLLNIITGIGGANGPITLSNLLSAADVGALLGVGAVTGFLALATGGLGIGIIFSYAITVAVALFIGYLSLMLRKVLILAALIFAPLAILVWIFPGNDKLWGLWKTTFFGMLLLFPIITGIIGVGRLAAYIVSQM